AGRLALALRPDFERPVQARPLDAVARPLRPVLDIEVAAPHRVGPCRRLGGMSERPPHAPTIHRAVCSNRDLGCSRSPPSRSTERETEAEAFKGVEAAGWDAKAPTSERLTGRVTARVVESLLDAAVVERGTRTLDLATGTGTIAAAAAARGAVAVGVDLAEGMIDAARARHPDLDFRQADAEQLPFEEAAFDAVVAGFVFNHLPRPEPAAA